MSDRTRRNFGRVMKRDGGRCRYCGELADSVDHVMPWAYRPNNSPSNLVAACMRCNLIASDLVFASFEAKRAYIARPVDLNQCGPRVLCPQQLRWQPSQNRERPWPKPRGMTVYERQNASSSGWQRHRLTSASRGRDPSSIRPPLHRTQSPIGKSAPQPGKRPV